MNIMRLDDFSRETYGLGYSDQHLRIHSGRSTIGRIAGTATGISRFFAPPFVAGDFALALSVESISHGTLIRDLGRTGHGIEPQWMLQGERWHPSHLWRRGSFHGQTANGVLSLGIETRLVPSSLHDGFFLEVEITNRDDSETTLILKPDWQCHRFGISRPGEWAWDPPSINYDPTNVGPGHLRSIAPTGDRPDVDLYLNWNGDEGCEWIKLHIAPGGRASAILNLSWTKSEDSSPRPCGSIDASLAKRNESWQRFWDAVPHFTCNCLPVERAYQHALLTFFLTRWESPHLDVNPHYAEAGLDGGAFCNYTWGECYASKMMAIVEGQAWKQTLVTHLRMGLDRHYAFDPCGSAGVGPYYAYNISSIAIAIEDYLYWTGDKGFLDEDAGGQTVWRMLIDAVTACEEGLPDCNGLLDYGDNHHLLEMRSRGYEHIVPSPNAERVRMYRFIADVLHARGDTIAATAYRKRADIVRTAIRERLWDEESGWLRCLRPDGPSELVFSIQIFDLLGLGILDPDQEARVVARINDREFLSSHGLNSIAKSDERHFDLGDVDWSGGGAFSGDPGNLIEALYVMDRADLAKQVMERILWWSDVFPYWPQSICAMQPSYSRWEQPINRSALAFAQAIVFGLFGLELQDGQPVLKPRRLPGGWRMHLNNVRVHGQVVSANVE